jgi:GTP cyclohydrolase II
MAKKKEGAAFIAEATLPTRFGNFRIHAFRETNGKEHVALVAGKPRKTGIVPVRIHSKCLTGDTLCSLRCDCRAQLEASLHYLNKHGGILIYLDQEGRGIGLANKINAYALQEQGLDTMDANLALGFPADLRTYKVAAGILRHFGITRIRLLTNNPQKLDGLEGNGIKIVERIALNTEPTRYNKRYLETKKKRMGHL